MAASLLSDAELHGLVDGHVPADRRPEILHRIAASPLDQERVACWQEQSDLIRDLFRGVEKEPLPAALDLRPPPHLMTFRAVSARAPGGLRPAKTIAGREDGKASVGRRWLEMIAAAVVVAGGLSVAWVASRSVPQRFALAGSVAAADDTLARHAVAALSVLTTPVPSAATPLPTTSIPDLSAFGFAFSTAEMRAGEPASLVFRYRNGAAEQIAVAVTRASGRRLQSLEARYDAFVWRAGSIAYAVAGSLDRDRLRAIAVSLRDAAVNE